MVLSDIDIKRDVQDELRSNPDIDATDIAVAVKSGVVTLSGFVRSYSQRWEAERTVKRVNGTMKVIDGPFIESKETVGGFALIEVGDLDKAIAIAKSWPGGDVEVRPIVDHSAVEQPA